MSKLTKDINITNNDVNAFKKRFVEGMYSLIDSMSLADEAFNQDKKALESLNVIEAIIKNDFFKEYLVDNLPNSTDSIYVGQSEITTEEKTNKKDSSIKLNDAIILNRSEIYSVNDLNGDIDFINNELSSLKKSTKDSLETKEEAGDKATGFAKQGSGWTKNFYENKPDDADYWFIKLADKNNVIGDVATTPKILTLFFGTITEKVEKPSDPKKVYLRKGDNGEAKWVGTSSKNIIPEEATEDTEGLVQFTKTVRRAPNLIIAPSFIIANITKLNEWDETADDRGKTASNTYIAGFDPTTKERRWVKYNNLNSLFNGRNPENPTKSFIQLVSDLAHGDTFVLNPLAIGATRGANPFLNIPQVTGRGVVVKEKVFEDVELTVNANNKLQTFAEDVDKANEGKAVQAFKLKDKIKDDDYLKHISTELQVVKNNTLVAAKKHYDLKPEDGYSTTFKDVTLRKFLRHMQDVAFVRDEKEKRSAGRVRFDNSKAMVFKKSPQYKVDDGINYKTNAINNLSYDGSSLQDSVVVATATTNRTVNGKQLFKVAEHNILSENKTSNVEVEYESTAGTNPAKEASIVISNDNTAALATRIQSDIFNYDTLYIKNLDNKTTITNQDLDEVEINKITTLTKVYKSKISPSGKYILIVADKSIFLYAIKGKTPLIEYTYYVPDIKLGTSISFSYNEKAIAIGTNKEEIELITTENHIHFKRNTIKSTNRFLEVLDSNTTSKLKTDNYLLFGSEVKFIPNRNQFITTIPATRSIQVFTYLEANNSYELTQTVNEIDVINEDGVIETQEDTYMNIAISPCVSYLICGTAAQKTICLYKLIRGNKPIVEVPMQRIKVQRIKVSNKIQAMFSTIDPVLYLHNTANGSTTRYERKLSLFEAGSTTTIAPNAEITFDSLKEEIKAYKPIHDNNFNERLIAKWASNTVDVYSKASADEKYHIQKIVSFKKGTATTIELTSKCGYFLIKEGADQVLYKLKPEARQKKNSTILDAFDKIHTFTGATEGLLSANARQVAVKKNAGIEVYSNIDDLTAKTTKTGNLDRANAFSETTPATAKVVVTHANSTLKIGDQITHVAGVNTAVVDTAGTTVAVFTAYDIILYSILPLHDAQIPTTHTSPTGSIDIKKLDISENNVIGLYSLHEETGSKGKGDHATITAYRKSQGSYYKFHHETAITTLKEEPYLKLSKDGNYIQFNLNNNVIKTVDIRDGSTVSTINTKSKIGNSLKQKITATDDLMSVFFIEDDTRLYSGSAITGTKLLITSFKADANCCITCSNDGLFVYIGIPSEKKILVYEILKNKQTEVKDNSANFGKSIYYSDHGYITVATDAGATVMIDTYNGYKNRTGEYNQKFIDFKTKEFLSKPGKTCAYVYSINKQGFINKSGEFTYQELDDVGYGKNVQIVGDKKTEVLSYETNADSENATPLRSDTNIFYQYSVSKAKAGTFKTRTTLTKYPTSTKTRFKERNSVTVVQSQNKLSDFGYAVAMGIDTAFISEPSKSSVHVYKEKEYFDFNEYKKTRSFKIKAKSYLNAPVASKDGYLVYEILDDGGTVYQYVYSIETKEYHTRKSKSKTAFNPWVKDGNIATFEKLATYNNSVTEDRLVKYFKLGVPNSQYTEIDRHIESRRDTFPNSVSISGDATKIIACSTGQPGFVKVYLLDEATRKYKEIQKISVSSEALEISDDGNTFVVTKETTTVYTWDKASNTFKLKQSLSTPSAWHDVGITADGKYITVGGDRKNYLVIFELKNGTYVEKQRFTGSGRFGFGTAISKNGRYAAAGTVDSERAYIYELKNNNYVLIQTLHKNESTFGSTLAFSGDGTCLVVGSYKYSNAYIYELKNNTYQLKQTISRGDGFGVSVGVDDDASHIVVVYDGKQVSEMYALKNNTYTLTQTFSGQGGSSWNKMTAITGDSRYIVFGIRNYIFTVFYKPPENTQVGLYTNNANQAGFLSKELETGTITYKTNDSADRAQVTLNNELSVKEFDRLMSIEQSDITYNNIAESHQIDTFYIVEEGGK